MNKRYVSQVKYRHEIKYVCTQAQLAVIGSRIGAICPLDSHVDQKGQYTIRSVYFDDFQNSCYYDNQTGANPRSKYRIRIYNCDFTHITLEKKSKQDDKTYKESCPISQVQCSDILDGSVIWKLDEGMPPLLKRFYIDYKNRLLRPKIIVEYERVPYVYRDGNVRITFDRNISSCHSPDAFFQKTLPLRPVMPCGHHILEVKYDEFLPDVIYNSLQIRDLHKTAYSKYYLSRNYQ